MTYYSIGIDLGTSFSCSGILIDNKISFIPNNENNINKYIIPSYVAFTDTNEILIGESAKNQIEQNPNNTIYNIKRLIGRKYSDPDIQNNLHNYKYNIVPKDDNIFISIIRNGQEILLSPEEISALILKEIKLQAESYINHNIINAVITVPAYFNDSQRQATINSANMVGLNVLKIISEPVSASIAYGFEKDKINKNIVVYDFGAGTLDVTLLQIKNETYNIMAISGNTSFGGEDFTHQLLNYFIKDIKSKTNNDLYQSDYKKQFLILKKISEQIKIALSDQTNISIQINNLFDDFTYTCEMNRSTFENLCQNLFDIALEPVKSVLNDANMFRYFIDEIVLVGGSSRIPKIRNILGDYFGNGKINLSIDPDKAVAYGAAIQANLLSGTDLNNQKKIDLLDVAPLSIGINSTSGKMIPIIHRNIKIPCIQNKTFVTNVDNQEDMLIKIYQGERVLSKDCHFIGDCVFDDISIGKKGSIYVEITFCIDINGILHVYANDKIKNNKQKINIKYDINKLSYLDIINSINDATINADNDNNILKNLEAISSYNNILEYATEILADDEIKALLEVDSVLNTEYDPINISNIVEEEFIWLNSTSRNYLEINQRENNLMEKIVKIPSYNDILSIVLKKNTEQINTESVYAKSVYAEQNIAEPITEPIILTEPITEPVILTEPIITEPILIIR